MAVSRADTNTRALVGLRVAVGVLFLIFAQYKVFGTQFTLGGGFQYWINNFLKEGAYPFMVPMLKGFVLGHATAIAFIVAYAELTIGLALVFHVRARRLRLRPCLYAHAAVCGQLSGRRRSALGVFRSVTGTPGPGDVLCDFRARR